MYIYIYMDLQGLTHIPSDKKLSKAKGMAEKGCLSRSRAQLKTFYASIILKGFRV